MLALVSEAELSQLTPTLPPLPHERVSLPLQLDCGALTGGVLYLPEHSEVGIQ